MSDCVPAVLKLVISVAVPEAKAAVPSELEPLRNVTVPEAAVGVTVAVKVTDEPTATELADATSVIAEDVPVVVLPVGGFQKSPHPVKRRAPKTTIRRKAPRLALREILIAPSLGVR